MHSHSFQDTELKLCRWVQDDPGQVVEGLKIVGGAPLMLTRPQPYKVEAETETQEAKTHEAEARFFGLEDEFEARFMRRQRFEKPKKF